MIDIKKAAESMPEIESLYSGNDLIRWGLKPGAWFKDAIVKANALWDAGYSEDEIKVLVSKDEPTFLEMRKAGEDKMIPFSVFLEPENEVEQQNANAVMDAMRTIMRVPVVTGGAVMPDACPAGTIPVGGVVESSAIHPSYHSADVCCSMAMTVFESEHDPKELLDKIQELTHFGPTKREKRPVELPEGFTDQFDDNIFLTGLEDVAREHFTTQGDGNHFYYVGHLESSGKLAIVSHHGSRGFGARVYKRGKQAAEKHTRNVAPKVPKQHAWISPDDHGHLYWEALQTVREWTKLNHFMLHDEIVRQMGGKIRDRTWNPHNFVFHRDGMFYHAKGATPSFNTGFDDDDGITLIPMNMAEPILITNHVDNEHALGFAPHGAGRNMSRTAFLRDHQPDAPEDIDVRFWCGIEDKSELPQAYKSAETVIRGIEEHGLANVLDRVMPYGSIMAGDWEQDAPWRKKREKK